MTKLSAAVLAAALFSGPGAAMSATIIELRGTDSGHPIDNDIEVNGERARITVRDGGQSTDVLYHASADTMYVIQHEDRSYLEFTEEELDQMGTQLKNMMAQIQSQLNQSTSGMSAEQQAALSGMLAQMGLNAPPAPADEAVNVEFSASGPKTEVAGIPCVRGALSVDGEPGARLCVARRDDIGIPPADYDTLVNLVQFGGRVADKLTSLFPGAAPRVPPFDVTSLDGLPVQIEDGNMSVAVTAVRQEPRPPITLPDGYTKRMNPLIGQ